MPKFNKKGQEVKSPIEFVKDGEHYQESPISFMDKDINTETSFAITKLTDNGKYMRGNMLFYSLNGVEVYTDSNNIIFVDTDNNTLFIREYSKVEKEIAPTDPEQRQYIILYTNLGYDELAEEDNPLIWAAFTGRTDTYNAIKVMAPVIDIDKSIILVESVAVEDALTVRQFVKYLKNANLTEKDGFDIDEYSPEYIL